MREMRFLGPLIVAAMSFAVYLRTLLPGVAFGDWGEMQTVPHVLGVAHPTGYPTYILIAWLAELLPIGSVAFRANLLSAAFVAAALATVTVIAGRLGARQSSRSRPRSRWVPSGRSGPRRPSARSTRSTSSSWH